MTLHNKANLFLVVFYLLVFSTYSINAYPKKSSNPSITVSDQLGNIGTFTFSRLCNNVEAIKHCLYKATLHSNLQNPQSDTPFLENLHQRQHLHNISISRTDDLLYITHSDPSLSKTYKLDISTLPLPDSTINSYEKLLRIAALHPSILARFQAEHSHLRSLWWALSWVNLQPIRWLLGIGDSDTPFTSSLDTIPPITKINENSGHLTLETEDHYTISIQTNDTAEDIYLGDPYSKYYARSIFETIEPIVNIFDLAGLVTHSSETLKFTFYIVWHKSSEAFINLAYATHNAFEFAIHTNHIDSGILPIPKHITQPPINLYIEAACVLMVTMEYI
ncbi:hypothetical protein ACH42_15220 [Endozoicomonas sp. (ex Bugula neritina AB1)]|nr:hypothetical protein ACH42_15220 [Endozoicomonas sp. (ex Bugula neritina AB1)]